MSDEPPVSDENAALFELWASSPLQGASPPAAVTLESWTNVGPRRSADLSALGHQVHALPLGPASPFLRLTFHGYPSAERQFLPDDNPTFRPRNRNGFRVEVEDHLVVPTPKGPPVIELFAAGVLIGRCHFRDAADLPEPDFKREARTNFFEVFYELDLLDLVLGVLRRKRDPIWLSDEWGLEG